MFSCAHTVRQPVFQAVFPTVSHPVRQLVRHEANRGGRPNDSHNRREKAGARSRKHSHQFYARLLASVFMRLFGVFFYVMHESIVIQIVISLILPAFLDYQVQFRDSLSLKNVD